MLVVLSFLVCRILELVSGAFATDFIAFKFSGSSVSLSQSSKNGFTATAAAALLIRPPCSVKTELSILRTRNVVNVAQSDSVGYHARLASLGKHFYISWTLVVMFNYCGLGVETQLEPLKSHLERS